jgi:hypothetical protein
MIKQLDDFLFCPYFLDFPFLWLDFNSSKSGNTDRVLVKVIQGHARANLAGVLIHFSTKIPYNLNKSYKELKR